MEVAWVMQSFDKQKKRKSKEEWSFEQVKKIYIREDERTDDKHHSQKPKGSVKFHLQNWIKDPIKKSQKCTIHHTIFIDAGTCISR